MGMWRWKVDNIAKRLRKKVCNVFKVNLSSGRKFVSSITCLRNFKDQTDKRTRIHTEMA